MHTKNTAGRTAIVWKGFAILFAVPILLLCFYFLSNHLELSNWVQVIGLSGIYSLDILLRDFSESYQQEENRKKANVALNFLIFEVLLFFVFTDLNTNRNVLGQVATSIFVVIFVLALAISLGLRNKILWNEEHMFKTSRGTLCKTAAYIFNTLNMMILSLCFYTHWATWFVFVPVILTLIFIFISYLYKYEIDKEVIVSADSKIFFVLLPIIVAVISLVCQFWFYSIFGFAFWKVLTGLIICALFLFFIFWQMRKTEKQAKKQREEKLAEETKAKQTAEKNRENADRVEKLADLQNQFESDEYVPRSEDILFLYENLPRNNFIPLFKKVFKRHNIADLLQINRVHRKIIWQGATFEKVISMYGEIYYHTYGDDQFVQEIGEHYYHFLRLLEDYKDYPKYKSLINIVSSKFEDKNT